MKINGMARMDLEHWKARFCEIEKSDRHWEEGRSAWALAYFIAKHGGEDKIVEQINKILVDDRVVSLNIAEIECRCPFDGYRNARRQDMGIVGQTEKGKNVFIGIEAKVDESFGPTVGEAIKAAEKYRKKHPTSKRVDRISGLCEKFGVKPTDDGIDDLRYQLFHFTAGTACAASNNGRDILGTGDEIHVHVMLTLVFKTSKYNAQKGIANKADYDRFIKRFFHKGLLKKCQLPARPYAIYCEIPL